MSDLSNARRCAWIAALGCMLVLGCSTPPPPPPASAPSAGEVRAVRLKELGFTPSENGWELSLGVKLLFESNVDALSDEGRAAVADVARTLATLGIDRIRVEGHTDNVGTAKYNAALSLRRAQSVAQQFVKIGWRDDAIERKGFGADKPVVDNATPLNRAQNRRVVIAVQAG
jgi:outer membrane protein OmpA-like peptidoglycan-associated protein